MQRPKLSGMSLPGIFALAVFLLPFNSIQGFSFVGELQMEAAFYVFTPLLLLFGLQIIAGRLRQRALDPALQAFFLLTTLAILVSFIFNMDLMFENNLRDRAGIHKFFTSLLVLFYGMALAWMTAHLALREKHFFRRAIVGPTLWALSIVVAVGFIEWAGWFSPLFYELYDGIAQVVRAGSWPNYSEGRLRSITFEPPFLGMYLAAALLMISPILRIQNRQLIGGQGVWLLFALGGVILLLTGARTAFVILLSLTAFHFLFRPMLHARGAVGAMLILAIFLMTFGIFLLMQKHHAMIAWVVAGESVSNLSRYASNVAAFAVFTEHPVLGVGLGQYAFYAVDTMPTWGWYSYEIQEWFHDPDAAWPPVFSVPARLLAEGGLLLFLTWYGCLIALFSRLMLRVGALMRQGQGLPTFGYTLLLAMIFVFALGAAFDSFRSFWVWIILGLVSAYLRAPDPEALLGGDHAR